MKRIAFVAAVLAVTACAGEAKKEEAPAADAPAAAPAMDTSMKMDTAAKAAAPAADAKTAEPKKP